MGLCISCNLRMTLHGKMYLAESQFQNGTRVRQAATELQVSPEVLAIEIKSQTVVFFYMISLLPVLLNKVDSTRNGLYFFPFFPPIVKTGSLEYCISQIIKYVSEQMRTIQTNDSYALVRLCVSLTPIDKIQLFSKLWIMSDSEKRRYWAGVVTL